MLGRGVRRERPEEGIIRATRRSRAWGVLHAYQDFHKDIPCNPCTRTMTHINT